MIRLLDLPPIPKCDDDATAARGFDTGVGHPRVFVAADPPMLTDLLARVLDRPDLEIVVDRGHTIEVGTERFEVAVISGSLPPHIRAEVVIRLPDTLGGAGVAVVETEGRRRRVRVSDMTDLTRLLDRIRPRPGVEAH
jgi:hypothetical protein